jgi:hypothetical protein
MDLFEHNLAEVKSIDGIRYVLRRNPARAEEIQKAREDKLKALMKNLNVQNKYLMNSNQ